MVRCHIKNDIIQWANIIMECLVYQVKLQDGETVKNNKKCKKQNKHSK